MKILHIAMGTPEFDRAATELGHDVRRIHWPDYFGRKNISIKPIEPAIAEAVKVFAPDLVFIQTHERQVVSEAALRFMKTSGAMVVFWVGDVRDPLPAYYLWMAHHVHIMALTNEPDVEHLRSLGHDARFLQIGYDETIFNTTGPVAKDAPDVVFMGSNYIGRFPLSNHRAELVAALYAKFGKRFKVYGTGWSYPGVRYVNNQEEAAIYRGCKVAIHADHFDREGFFSDRWLRAQACGAATLNLTAVPVDEAVAIVCEELENEDARYHASLCAESTRLNDTWHNRINTLEGWLKS
jgi:hypothetical protein